MDREPLMPIKEPRVAYCSSFESDHVGYICMHETWKTAIVRCEVRAGANIRVACRQSGAVQDSVRLADVVHWPILETAFPSLTYLHSTLDI